MAQTNIQQFRSTVGSDNLAKANRFEVEIQPPNILKEKNKSFPAVINLFCEETAFPGLMINSAPIRINNLNIPRASTIDFGGNQLTFTFYSDQKFKIKEYFDTWMRSIINPDTREIAFYKNGEQTNYSTTLKLKALDTQDRIIQQFEIIEAYPRAIAPLPVSHSNSNIHRISVTFTYKTWKSETENIEQTPNFENPQYIVDEIQNNTTSVSADLLSGEYITFQTYKIVVDPATGKVTKEPNNLPPLPTDPRRQRKIQSGLSGIPDQEYQKTTTPEVSKTHGQYIYTSQLIINIVKRILNRR